MFPSEFTACMKGVLPKGKGGSVTPEEIILESSWGIVLWEFLVPVLIFN